MPVMIRDKSFYKYLLLLALPIMGQGLVSFGINITDNLMVGKLGEAAISGVYFGSQIQGFLTMLVGGIEGGMLILSAQYWGKRDVQSIRRIVSLAIRLSVICGIIFFIASLLFAEPILRLFTGYESSMDMVIKEGVVYLQMISFSFVCFSISQLLITAMRSVESVRIGLYMSLLSFVGNIILNYILIFGFDPLNIRPMGVAGAALATTICRVMEMVIALFYVFKVDQVLNIQLKDFLHFNKRLFRSFMRVSLPVIGGQVVWSANMLCQSAIIGRMGANAASAVSVSNMLFNLVYVGMMGLGSAVSIITGKTVGAGKFELMKQYAKTIQVLFLCAGVVCGAVIFTMRGFFVTLYDVGPETVHLAMQFMLVLSVTVIGTSYQATCLSGLVKAGGDISFVFINDTIFVFLVVLPSAWIALNVLKAPLWVVFLCLKSDQILKCFVAVVKINRFNWMKNLTKNSSSDNFEILTEETVKAPACDQKTE